MRKGNKKNLCLQVSKYFLRVSLQLQISNSSGRIIGVKATDCEYNRMIIPKSKASNYSGYELYKVN